MARSTLNLKSNYSFWEMWGNGVLVRGAMVKGMKGNWRMRKRGMETRIVCVKVFGPSAVWRDGWFSGIRWQVSLTRGLRWYEGLISHSGLAYEKYERPSASPALSPTPSVYYKIITTKSRPEDCWKTQQQHTQTRRRSRTRQTNVSQHPRKNTSVLHQRNFFAILKEWEQEFSWAWLLDIVCPGWESSKTAHIRAHMPEHMSYTHT